MLILHQSALFSPTSPPVPPVPPVPVLLLPAPPKRLALPQPKIAGLLPATIGTSFRFAPGITRIVVAQEAVTYVEPDDDATFGLYFDDFENTEAYNAAWWREFERRYGRIRTLEESNAELAAGFARRQAEREAFYKSMKSMGVRL